MSTDCQRQRQRDVHSSLYPMQTIRDPSAHDNLFPLHLVCSSASVPSLSLLTTTSWSESFTIDLTFSRCSASRPYPPRKLTFVWKNMRLETLSCVGLLRTSEWIDFCNENELYSEQEEGAMPASC